MPDAQHNLRPFWPPQPHPTWSDCVGPRLSINLVTQLLGLVQYLEGRPAVPARDVFASSATTSLLPQWGPAPKPWRGRSNFLFPRPQAAAGALRVILDQDGSGLFIARADDEQVHNMLADEKPRCPCTHECKCKTVIWAASIAVAPEDLIFDRAHHNKPFNHISSHNTTRLFTATFFDKAFLNQPRTRKRNERISVLQHTVSALPNWLDPGTGWVSPILVMSPVLKPALPTPTGLPLATMPQRARRALNKARKPRFSRFNGTPPVPPPCSYNVNNIESLINSTPYASDPQLAREVIRFLRHGAGKTRPPEDQTVAYIPDNDNLSEREHKQLWDITQENVRLGYVAHHGTTGPAFPNALCPFQPKSLKIAVTYKKKNWFWIRDLPSYQPAQHPLIEQVLDKYSSKCRLVSNKSALVSTGISTNELSHGARAHVLHFGTPDIVNFLARHGPNVLWILADVKSAYKTLSHEALSLWACVFMLNNPDTGFPEWFTDLVEVFGSQDSEAAWQIFMAVIIHIVRYSPGHQSLRESHHYVDNVHTAITPLANGAPDHKTHTLAQKLLFATISSIGMQVHELQFGHDIESLGWDYRGGPSLSFAEQNFQPARKEMLLVAVDHWLSARTANAKNWKSIGDVFTWAGSYFSLLRCYGPEIRKATHQAEKSKRPVEIKGPTLEALTVIQLMFQGETTGRQLTPREACGVSPDQICRTDGSTLNGTGGLNLTTLEYFLHPITEEIKATITREGHDSSLHIETLAFQSMANLALKPDSVLLIQTDNDGLKKVWEKGWSKVTEINSILRATRLAANAINCLIVVEHIEREYNECANALAEQSVDRFAQWVVRELGLQFCDFKRLD